MAVLNIQFVVNQLVCHAK